MIASVRENNGTTYMRIMPPCHSFAIELPVITSGSRQKTNSWTWNGDLESPTLKPSIRTIHETGQITHLWLTDGVCHYLDDSEKYSGECLPLSVLKNIEGW